MGTMRQDVGFFMASYPLDDIAAVGNPYIGSVEYPTNYSEEAVVQLSAILFEYRNLSVRWAPARGDWDYG